jgi:hypothetical protein
VLGARGALSQAAGEVYDEQRISERACVILVAIDARSLFYPSLSPFDDQPFAGLTDKYGYNDETKARVIQTIISRICRFRKIMQNLFHRHAGRGVCDLYRP